MSETTTAGVHATYWILVANDLANAGAVATATLKSGVHLTGRINKSLSGNQVLSLTTAAGGYHVIDYTEIAALSGERQ